MTHILVGDNQGDLDTVADFAWRRKAIFWPVPKQARISERVLFFFFQTGLTLQGTVKTEPKFEKPGTYVAAIENLRYLKKNIPIESLVAFLPKWKWPKFPLRRTSISGAIEKQLVELAKVYVDEPDPTPDSPQIPPQLKVKLKFEGGSNVVPTLKYERSPSARAECLKHHGHNCSACGLAFGKKYGPSVAGFIHVHHLTAISSRGGKHEVDPVKDLRPVCPNCHAVIHLFRPPLTIEKLKLMLKRRQPQKHPT